MSIRKRPLSLSIGQWQMVEIKALARNAKIIAFDEPTSSLSAREIENLFRVIRELRKEGRIILYVSHRMEEIFALSDAITVFKDGRYVRTFTDMQQVNHDQLVQAMVGRDLGTFTTGNRASMARSVCVWITSKPGRAHAHFTLGAQRRNRRAVWPCGAGRSELMKGLFGGTRITLGGFSSTGKGRYSEACAGD